MGECEMGLSRQKANRRNHMSKNKNEFVTHEELKIDEALLFERVSDIIENRKYRAGS